MLRSISEITGYKLSALDGQIGRCKDFLFDDQKWTLRYMVADTGMWLQERRVLIPPFVLRNPDWATRTFPLDLRKQEIENAPELDADAPISRLYEKKYHNHFGWPYYWVALYPGCGFIPANARENQDDEISQADIENATLRSTNEVTGYNINSIDGIVGHVEDFILDSESWTIRYMVVDTRDWLPGRKVLVSPEWISKVNWPEQQVAVELLSERIENSPPYDPSQPINSTYESRLYDYYGRPAAWVNQPA